MNTMALYQDIHAREALLPIAVKASPARNGFARRVSALIERWKQRHTEQEAGRFIAEHGGRLTDDVERQLTDHFNGRGFPPYAPPQSLRFR
jgi:hypothetical protein